MSRMTLDGDTLGMTDAEHDDHLVKLYQQGQDDAFSELVERHDGRLQGWLRRKFHGQLTVDDVNDVVQDSWIKIADVIRSHKYEAIGRFQAFLYRVATHTALDRLKSVLRRPDSVTVTGDLPEPDSEPTRTKDVDLQLDLEAKCSALPPFQFTVVTLRYVYGYVQEETARMLGVSRDRVRTAERNAIQKLGFALERNHDAESPDRSD